MFIYIYKKEKKKKAINSGNMGAFLAHNLPYYLPLFIFTFAFRCSWRLPTIMSP